MRATYLPELNVGQPQLVPHHLFWDFCGRGELRFQRCTDCGAFRHPPSPLCPGCRSAQSRWDLAPDDAELFSYTVVHHATHPALKEVLPYNVAVVAFPSIGYVRIVSNVVDAAPDELQIGMPLLLTWQASSGDRKLPLFRKKPGVKPLA